MYNSRPLTSGMKYYNVLLMALTSLALTGFLHRLRSRLPRWNVLTNAQKVALVSFISLTVMLPIITLATLTETRLGSRAAPPVTPPITPPTTPTPTPSLTPRPSPTPVQETFDIDASPLVALVKQPFRVSWTRTTTTGTRAQIDIIIPAGIATPNWGDSRCRQGTGCTITTFDTSSSGTKTISYDAYALRTGSYEIKGNFNHFASGIRLTDKVEVTINPTPTLTPILTPTPTPTPPAPTPIVNNFTVRAILRNSDGTETVFPSANAAGIIRFEEINGSPTQPRVNYVSCMSGGILSLPIVSSGTPCSSFAPGRYATQWKTTVKVGGTTYKLIYPTICTNKSCSIREQSEMITGGQPVHRGVYQISKQKVSTTSSLINKTNSTIKSAVQSVIQQVQQAIKPKKKK